MNFGEKILDYKEDILKDLDELLKIQSVSSKSQEDASEALKFILKRAEEMGLTTENVDDIAGHAEYGKGDEIAAVLSHVDVVPSGDGWSVEPFALTRKNGRLYGRGIADDKGPAIIALYCLKALKDSGVSFKRRLFSVLLRNLVWLIWIDISQNSHFRIWALLQTLNTEFVMLKRVSSKLRFTLTKTMQKLLLL